MDKVSSVGPDEARLVGMLTKASAIEHHTDNVGFRVGSAPLPKTGVQEKRTGCPDPG